MVKKSAQQVGLGAKVSPHVFRHSCATHMLDHGADIRAVQELLGHASISTTQVYTMVSKEKLWEAYRAAQMSTVDRSHAVRSARSPALADDAQRVAAALHDVGKIQAGLGTWARVGATVAGAVLPGLSRGRWADYRDHPRLGAVMLRDAGSAKLTVAWAAEHHLSSRESSLLPEVAAALAAAD